MPLSYKEKGLHTRTVRTHGLVTQYCGNGALSDLDSGITAFNLFNTKFLEGFTLRTNIGWRDTNIADAATTRCSTSPTNGTHSGGYWEPRYNRCPTCSGW